MHRHSFLKKLVNTGLVVHFLQGKIIKKEAAPLWGELLSRGTTQIDLRPLVFAVSGEPVGFLIHRSRAEQICFAAASHHTAAL